VHQRTDITKHFALQFGTEPTLVIQSPGRINLIGEHTDYNEGWVFPAAINKYLWFACSPRPDAEVHITALDIQAHAVFAVEDLSVDDRLWLTYLKGILHHFALEGHHPGGFNCVFGGNLPIGAGISSSAALEVGFAAVINHLSAAGKDRVALAQLAQRSSREFVGIPCGIMDQFASSMGKKDHFILLDCRDLSYTYIPAVLDDYQLVLLDTGVTHSNVASEYGTRVAECREGLEALRQIHPEMTSLRDAGVAEVIAIRGRVSEAVYQRCLYVVEEINRVAAAKEALLGKSWDELGRLMFATHRGLQHLYEVSCPELDFLVDFAENFPGVAGARLMGGGFGGCTLNLIRRGAVDAFIAQAAEAYSRRFGREAGVILVEIADGTAVL
jgi:galactokinase